jgi:glucose/arabinose dehydrogenase
LKKHFIAASCVAAAIVGSVAIGNAQNPAPAAGAAPAAPAGQAARGGGPRDTLGEGPWDMTAGRGRVRLSVVTKGLQNPWGIAFVPGGDMLVTERPGRLRVIRAGKLDPTPIGPLPEIAAEGLGGLLDVTLHPNFAQNRLIYLAYSKPGPTWNQTEAAPPAPAAPPAGAAPAPAGRGRGGPRRSVDATTAVYRARWDGGSTLADGKDIFVADAYHGAIGTNTSVGPATGSYGTRIVFDKDGTMFVSLGDRNNPPMAQNMNSHIGKILRLKDDGTVPPDNPFVGKPGIKPEIWTSGHRNPLGMYIRPSDGSLWATEQGPQGGDELNKIDKGKNYGWPNVSLGRNYDGTPAPQGFSAPGFEEPVVFWVPAIAISGLSWYDSDKLPTLRNRALVGGLRANTGRHVQAVTFNAQGLPTGRELMFGELNQRIREVKPAPDGTLYILTDEAAGAVIKVEPSQ